MKKFIYLLSVCVAGIALFTACGRYNFIKEVSKEDKTARKRIYGDVDGPALQSKNTYPVGENAVKRSAELKAILFGTKTKSAAPASSDTSKANASQAM